MLGGRQEGRAYVRELLEHWEDGRIKLFATAAGLRLRRRMREVFLDGSYIPLKVDGPRAGHLIAFGRRRGAGAVIVAAGRLFASLNGAALSRESWGGTAMRGPMEPGLYRNALTGEEVEVEERGGEAVIGAGDALSEMPAAILYRGAEVEG